jgi:hypothetical protein
LDDATGQPALVVTSTEQWRCGRGDRSLPLQLRGIAVNVEVTEKFRALEAGSSAATLGRSS